MTKRVKQLLLNKRNSKGAPVGAVAVHSSAKDAKGVISPVVKRTPAALFLESLKKEIKKAL